MKRFAAQYSDDPNLNRVQKTLEESIGFLKDVELLDGKLHTVEIASGETLMVPHGLGRNFKGCFPVMIKETIDGTMKTYDYFVPAASDDNSLYYALTILGSDTLTVSFWIF